MKTNDIFNIDEAMMATAKHSHTNENHDHDECELCNGTGEGMYDGESCTRCDGTGIAPSSQNDDDYDDYDDEVDFEPGDEPLSHYERYVNQNFEEGVSEQTTNNPEYTDEVGYVKDNLHTILRACKELHGAMVKDENLPDWVQEKVAQAKGMLVAASDYLQSQHEQGRVYTNQGQTMEAANAAQQAAIAIAKKKKQGVAEGQLDEIFDPTSIFANFIRPASNFANDFIPAGLGALGTFAATTALLGPVAAALAGSTVGNQVFQTLQNQQNRVPGMIQQLVQHYFGSEAEALEFSVVHAKAAFLGKPEFRWRGKQWPVLLKKDDAEAIIEKNDKWWLEQQQQQQQAQVGMGEARASSASFRQGNAQRAEVNAMSPEERKAHEDKRAEQQRKRDDARMERERQRNAAKKGVAEGLGKDIKRAAQGWGGAQDKPADIVKRNKGYDTDTAKKVRAHLDNAPDHTPAGLQKRVLDRKLKGVAEGPDYAAMYEGKLNEFASCGGAGSIASALPTPSAKAGTLFGGSYSQKNSPFKKTGKRSGKMIKR